MTYGYDFINYYNSSIRPSTVHCQNTALFNYYVRYLIQKTMSVFEFENIPENWNRNYFLYVLFCRGFLAVINTDRYGIIPQECELADNITIFKQPKYAIITNPVFNKSKVAQIGKTTELIQLQPDYGNIMDIITTFADLMALCLETSGVNLINSKMSYVFFSENKSTAETFKKLYDKIASGEPMAVLDKDLLTEDGKPAWTMFSQNVGQNYIVDKIMISLKNIEDEFNTIIGIPNANTQKRERLISDEVLANDIDTKSIITTWIETLNDSMNKVNKMFNLNLSVKYRYVEYEYGRLTAEYNRDSYYNRSTNIAGGSIYNE